MLCPTVKGRQQVVRSETCANRPVVPSVCPVAELVADVQGGGGGVRAGPNKPPASITCATRGHIDRWAGSHCASQTGTMVYYCSPAHVTTCIIVLLLA